MLLGMGVWATTAKGAEICPVQGKFPASGQTTEYTAVREGGTGAVPVPDDGTVQAGANLRYVDRGDGTIKDKNTKLIWEKKCSEGCGGLHDVANTYVWSNPTVPGANTSIWDWVAQVNFEGGTGFAGHNDWRIPTVKELQSIVDYENPGPAVAAPFHTNCPSSSCTVLTCSCTAVNQGYWSSTTVKNYPGFGGGAWFVSFNFGTVSFVGKSVSLPVRAVRGGCVE